MDRIIKSIENKYLESSLDVVIVEGNPQNYRSRGFVTSEDFGITTAESVCLLPSA